MKNTNYKKGFVGIIVLGLLAAVSFGIVAQSNIDTNKEVEIAKEKIVQLEQEIEVVKQKSSSAEEMADEAFGATLKIPVPIALFETTLASSITSGATSMTLTSATDKDGNTLASSTYAFIIVVANCRSRRV